MIKIPDFKYRDRKDKSVMFFSASSPGDTRTLLESGIYDILISYHYLRKSPEFYENEVLPIIKEKGGLFMVDSGAFSYMKSSRHMDDADAWLPYLEEYVAWVDLHSPDLYSCANFDIDRIIGREVVDTWNAKYFAPLLKKVQVNFVAHAHEAYSDKTGMKRLREYCKYFDYVGVSNYMTRYAGTIATILKMHNCRIHGYAWTSIPMLKKFPFFSCDSTTWLGGMRYGTTYDYDGKNFKVLNHKKKFVRKTNKLKIIEAGIDFEGVLNEGRKEINLMNLEGWKGARYEYLKFANLKLSNKPVQFYAKAKK